MGCAMNITGPYMNIRLWGSDCRTDINNSYRSRAGHFSVERVKSYMYAHVHCIKNNTYYSKVQNLRNLCI